MNLESGLSGLYTVIFFTIDMAGQGDMEFRQWEKRGQYSLVLAASLNSASRIWMPS